MKNPQLFSNSQINLDELSLCQVASYYQKQLKMHLDLEKGVSKSTKENLQNEMANLHGERKGNAQEVFEADIKKALQAIIPDDDDGSKLAKLAKIHKLMLEDGTLPDKFIEMIEKNQCLPLGWQLATHIVLIMMVIGGLIGPL